MPFGVGQGAPVQAGTNRIAVTVRDGRLPETMRRGGGAQ